MAVYLCYISIALPFIIGFNIETTNDGSVTVIGVLEFIGDVLFGIDIVMNFRTAYHDADGNLVTSRW